MNAPHLNRRDFLSLTSAALAASAVSPSAAFAAPAPPPLKPFALGLLIVPKGAAEDKFRVLRDLGLNNCFLQLDAYINGYTPAVVSQFRDLIAKYEITVTTVEVVRPEPLEWNFLEGPSTIGIIPPKYRAARMDALRQVSDFAKQLGISQVQTHCEALCRKIPSIPSIRRPSRLSAPSRSIATITANTSSWRPARKRRPPCRA